MLLPLGGYATATWRHAPPTRFVGKAPALRPIFAWPVLAAGDDAWSLIDRIPGIPAAILVDEGGTVLRYFYGGDHQGLRGAIEDYLFS